MQKIITHIYVNGKRVEGLGVQFTTDLEGYRALIARTYQVRKDKVRFIYEEE